MSQLAVAPDGFWMKSHFYQEGHLLHVVTYSCIAGNPEIFRFSVDSRPIVRAVVKAHNMLHETKVSGEDVHAEIGSWFSNITSSVKDAVSSPKKALLTAAKMATSSATLMNKGLDMVPGVKNARESVMNKIHPEMVRAYNIMNDAGSLDVSKLAALKASKAGKTELLKQVSSAVQTAAASSGKMSAASSISFPKVDMSSVAAFSSANKALSSIKQANGAMAAAKKIVSSTTSMADKAKLRASLTKWAGATVKNAIANKVQVPSGISTVAQAMKLAKDAANKSRLNLATIAAKAKAGDVQASKMARIVTLAQNNSTSLSHISKSHAGNVSTMKGRAPVSSQLNGFPALLVARNGRIIPGRYVEKASADPAVILRGGKVLRGRFSVAGASDLFSGVNDLFGADYRSDFGSVGCANPFTRPAHLR